MSRSASSGVMTPGQPPLARPPTRKWASRGRSVVVGIGIGGLLLAGIGVPVSAADEEASVPRSGLIGEYIFNQTAGATVPNSATGAGAAAAATVINGNDNLWTGTSLVFTGGAKSTTADWVRLPDNILAGKQSATITVETKFDASMASNFNFLWNIGNDSTSSYYFASVRDKVRTAITTAGGGGEVNARSATSLTPDRWYSLTSVIDGSAGTISFFVDGVQVASAPTTLKPASVSNQTLNTIGRSPYPDPFYKGEVSSFRVYDRALSGDEIKYVSEVDAKLHSDSFTAQASAILDSVAPVTADDSVQTLPDYGGAVSWASSDPTLIIGGNGTTLTTAQPAAGSAPRTSSLTAVASVRGVTASRVIPVTIDPAAAASDPYGYMMVHFIEDAAGYAEKIYLDISRGDNPEAWDPLNGGKEILASDLGTTGVRDPHLSYNPETKTYYIIATDLRVFGGDAGSGSCTSWCHWTTKGSTKINVWESKDLVSWSAPRQFDVALDAAGQKRAELGMMWAPEATWVDDYDGQGNGAFVLYWSSTLFGNAEHTGPTYSRILWGATTDFTQGTYSYGGVFVDDGGDTIDTTVIQNEGKTYRITKDNSKGKGIYMESTTAARWWTPTASWVRLQTGIGAVWAGGNAGGVEGPAVFKSHSADKWYLYVDVIPSTGYRPMVTQNLDAGWSQLTDPGFSMPSHTKHGGIVSLTKAQYDAVRGADAASVVRADLGTAEVPAGADSATVANALPKEAEVVLAYNRGTAALPVTWDTSTVSTNTPGTYKVSGVVRTIGANFNDWRGEGGSTAYNAPNRVLSSSTDLTVTAQVVVVAARNLNVTLTSSTRCIAGKVVLTVQAANGEAVPVAATFTSPFGTKSFAAISPNKNASHAFTTRAASIPQGFVTADISATFDGQIVTKKLESAYAAKNCG
uniref:LamG-like jellyroll fold domain-containing protein n=1 Tax=Paenarthrobacter nicotinovorans TaxID=29320 RepID=UPI003F4930D6